MKNVDNKNKNSAGSANVMIIIAVVLLALALLCAVYLVLDAMDISSLFKKTEDTTVDDTTVAPATESHADVETETNSDGTPKKVVYYKDNVYNGSIDYVYDEEHSAVYEMYYDADDKLVECIKITVNYKGNVVLEEHSLNNEVFLKVEFNYYDDDTTVWQKTITDNKTDKELVTKERYSEDGLLIEKFTYEDSAQTGHTVYTYDESGNLTGSEEVSE